MKKSRRGEEREEEMEGGRKDQMKGDGYAERSGDERGVTRESTRRKRNKCEQQGRMRKRDGRKEAGVEEAHGGETRKSDREG